MMYRTFLLLVLVSFVFVTPYARGQQENLDRGVTDGPNLVKNASFEDSSKATSADHWSFDSSVFSIDSEIACEGSRSLRYVNDNPEIYSLAHQPVDCIPGARYRVSGRVKVNRITNGAAMVCLEWSDANGKWLGGSYFSAVPAENEGWLEISGATTMIPENAAHATLSCYLERGATGDVCFDQVSLLRYYPPIVLGMTTDHYRQQIRGGDVSVRVITSASEAQMKNYDSPQLRVTGNELDPPLVLEPIGIADGLVTFSFNTDALAPGTYDLNFTVKHPETGLDESFTRQMKRIDSSVEAPAFKSYIDADRRLILDGKPFFPIGLYMGEVNDDDLATIAESPFNCLMPYHMISRERLDVINAKNIKVIYSVKDVYVGNYDLTSDAAALEMIRSKVESIKDHPAICAWYINDEYPLTRLSELVAHRNFMEEIDPSRPTWVVLYQVDEIASYLDSFDVIGTDPYPIATKPASTAWVWSRKTNQGTGWSKAVWQVPQIFDWAVYKHNADEKEGCRAPTYDEMRGMIWMNIAGGANGIVCYSFFDLKRMAQEPGDAYGLPRVSKPFEQSWSEVCSVAREVADNSDILLATGTPLTLTPDDETTTEKAAENVGWRTYQKDGVTWILAVNLTEQAQSLTLKADSKLAAEATRIGSPDKVVVKDQTITLNFEPLEPILTGLRPVSE